MSFCCPLCCKCSLFCFEFLSFYNIQHEVTIKHVIFQVLTAASMKIRALWNIEQCSLGVDPDDGGSTHL
jgi:hypothetical protein